METGYQLTRQDLIYIALFGAGVGLILGLIPLVIAVRKGKTRMGLLADVVCTLLGAVSPVLAVLATVIFTWLVLRKGTGAKTETAEAPEAKQSE